MANFMAIRDADTKRRFDFIRRIKPEIAPVEGLSERVYSLEDFSLIWAAGDWAPISSAVDEEGIAVIWGDAINWSQSNRVRAEQLRQLWKDPRKQLESFDGFHAEVLYSPKDGLVVGADLLGLFPIYYYAHDDVLLVSSTPELFRYHPLFNMRLNPQGLVALLLINGLFEGETLLKDVKRLDAGHLLVGEKNGHIVEAPQYSIPVSTKYFDLSLRDHLELVDEALKKAIQRHVEPGKRYSLMLSGGLDSRMLAGYLTALDRNVVTVTEGLSTDNDMKFSEKVASCLGLKHLPINVGFTHYALYAGLEAKWEHLTGGFHGMGRWGLIRHFRQLTPMIIGAHLGDAILGGGRAVRVRSPSASETASLSFKSFFTQINSWGFRPDIAFKLLRREIRGDLITEMIQRVRDLYESYSPIEFQRAWCFDLHHSQRFHVGSLAWVYSFGAWPVLPLIDHKILEVIGGIPQASLENRRLQKILLRTKFPSLARLPLDHSSFDTTPLEPSTRQRLKHYLLGDSEIWKLSRYGQRIRRDLLLLLKQQDPRYYYRIWNMNNPGWQAIRILAEPLREEIAGIFNADQLNKLLPDPEAHISVYNSAIDTSGLKTLLGIMLWSKEHARASYKNCN